MVDYDGLAYHVGAPKRWLALGGLDYLPTHLHTQWPLGIEMLNLLLLPCAGDAACKPLIALFAALTLTATYALGARLASRQVGLVAAAIGLLRMGAPSINTTSVEVPLTFYVLLCATAMAHGAQVPEALERRRWLLVAGVCAGIACCVKLNGLLCLVFLVGAWLCLTRAHRGGFPLKAQANEVLRLVGVALLCASPWYLRSLFQTGNPLYPFVFGGRSWDAEGTRVLTSYFHTFDLPGGDYAARHAFVLRHLIKVFLLWGVALALPSPRWLRGVATGAALFALLQIWTSDNPRFLLPIVPFAALFVGWWATQLSKWVPFVGWGVPLVFCGLALPVAFGQFRGAFPLLVGTVSRDASIARYVNNREAFEWANLRLPPNAKVLYAPDNRTYFLEREVYWSSSVFQRRIRYDTEPIFREGLRREGIEYLIVNYDVYKDSAIDFETRTGWREAERQRLWEAAKRAVTLWRGRGVFVYRLALEGEPPHSQ
jgi:hypothetical protein